MYGLTHVQMEWVNPYIIIQLVLNSLLNSMLLVISGKYRLMKTVLNFVSSTHRGGDFRFLHLPFGVADASEVFQRVMNTSEHFAEFSEVVVDDLLVWGKSKDEHDQRLEATLRETSEIGVVLNKKS